MMFVVDTGLSHSTPPSSVTETMKNPWDARARWVTDAMMTKNGRIAVRAKTFCTWRCWWHRVARATAFSHKQQLVVQWFMVDMIISIHLIFINIGNYHSLTVVVDSDGYVDNDG